MDDFCGIAWENGFDFCPIYLQEIIDVYPMSFS
jgi:hypothetical protein